VSQQLTSIQFDDDQRLIDSAIDKHVFTFLSSSLVKNSQFHLEKYFVVRIHNLLTEFIYRMPEKIKDLKLRGEEFCVSDSQMMNSAYGGRDVKDNLMMMGGYAQQAGYHAIQNRMAKVESFRDFEDFMNLVIKLFSKFISEKCQLIKNGIIFIT